METNNLPNNIDHSTESSQPQLQETAGQQNIKNSNLIPVFLRMSILVILVGVFSYYLGTQQNKQTTALSPSPTASPTPISETIEPATSPELSKLIPEGYKTRYFDLNAYFWNEEKYPAELTAVDKNLLVPISCTAMYTNYGEGYQTHDDITKENKNLTDQSLLGYIKMIEQKYEGKEVNEIFSCSTQEDKTIVLYSLGPCGGGCSGIPYVGVVDGNSIKEVSKIDASMAYFGCRQPLQMTADMFYFKCGGGDGGGSSAAIYKLSLNALKVTPVRQCSFGLDEEHQEAVCK